MALSIFIEPDPARKRALQERLTALLPAWFGRPESNARYAAQAELLDGYVAERDGVRCGLLCLKWSGNLGAEVYWTGVDPSCHRSGIGRALIDAAVDVARKRGVRYLFVLSLHPDAADESYQKTRRFYESVGFAHVLDEHFPEDPDCPLAYYLKPL
jgi:GNAT superfamily N-acetyltransferase